MLTVTRPSNHRGSAANNIEPLSIMHKVQEEGMRGSDHWEIDVSENTLHNWKGRRASLLKHAIRCTGLEPLLKFNWNKPLYKRR